MGGWVGLWAVVVGRVAVAGWLLLIFSLRFVIRWLMVTVVIGLVVVGGCWFVFAFSSIEVNPNT